MYCRHIIEIALRLLLSDGNRIGLLRKFYLILMLGMIQKMFHLKWWTSKFSTFLMKNITFDEKYHFLLVCGLVPLESLCLVIKFFTFLSLFWRFCLSFWTLDNFGFLCELLTLCGLFIELRHLNYCVGSFCKFFPRASGCWVISVLFKNKKLPLAFLCFIPSFWVIICRSQ